jgi:pyruvate/2-oxoglutarate dehydrogenase complex dihydrolipoamide dehydrogenase (E3) component
LKEVFTCFQSSIIANSLSILNHTGDNSFQTMVTFAPAKDGVAVTDRGFINVDIQMRTNVPHIFAIGDIVGQPMLAHKAVHEAHVAAEVIAGEIQGHKELAAAAFNARVIPSVAYTDPEVAWVGLTEDSGLARKASRSRRACSPGPHPAARLRTAVTKA